MADKQTVLALTVAWLDAYDADKGWRYSNSAMVERSILEAISWAMKNGDTLVLDDLHNALSLFPAHPAQRFKPMYWQTNSSACSARSLCWVRLAFVSSLALSGMSQFRR